MAQFVSKIMLNFAACRAKRKLARNNKNQIRVAFASGAEKFLHLLAQEFKHENHKRDKAQTQNAKVELVPLPCKKAH